MSPTYSYPVLLFCLVQFQILSFKGKGSAQSRTLNSHSYQVESQYLILMLGKKGIKAQNQSQAKH